jgi:hypothetical protein
VLHHANASLRISVHVEASVGSGRDGGC